MSNLLIPNNLYYLYPNHYFLNLYILNFHYNTSFIFHRSPNNLFLDLIFYQKNLLLMYYFLGLLFLMLLIFYNHFIHQIHTHHSLSFLIFITNSILDLKNHLYFSNLINFPINSLILSHSLLILTFCSHFSINHSLLLMISDYCK